MQNTPGRIQLICANLSKEFQLAVPLHPDKLKRGKKLSDVDIKLASEAALKKFYQIAREERLRHNLGVIGRARVAFGLQQLLINLGYPAPLVKQVLFAMLTSVFVDSKG